MDDASYTRTDDLDLGAVNTRDDLIELLRTVRIRADTPSLRELETRTRKTRNPLSKTTVAEMLNGVRFPRKATLVAFLSACGVRGDSVDSWLRAWERVADREGQAKSSAVRTVAGEAGSEERAEQARGVQGPDRPNPDLPVLLSDPSALTMLRTFADVAKALRDCLTPGADDRPTGWPPDLRVPGEAAALSTAYGIRTMLLLEDGLAPDLVPVAESLRTMAFTAGGYAGREQSEPRPEATAAVLNALCRIAAMEDFEAHIAQMKRDLGDFEKCRPFILTTMLETCLLLNPGIELVDILVDSLLAARRPYGDVLLWPEKAEPTRVPPAPSVAHTARAVRVLVGVQALRPADQVQEALNRAVSWLTEQRDLRNAYEAIERSVVNERPELVHVRHFTAAWVVKALVSAGVPAADPSVSNAVAQVLNSYGGDTAALWAWDNGDLPIWMTFDAIEALRLASLAIPRGALAPPP